MFFFEDNVWLGHKTAVLLLGGDKPQKPLPWLRQAEFIAAADSGAEIALAEGINPNLLVGDFDSLSVADVQQCADGGAEIVRLPRDKDWTDGEFLLQRCANDGFKRLLILGALGGRFDQTLANINICLPYAQQGIEVILPGTNEILLLLAAKNSPRQLILQGFKGRRLSLLSLSAICENVALQGFCYPLDAPLRQEVSLGISNTIEDECAKITLTNGNLLVCLDGGI